MPKLYHQAEGWTVPGKQDRHAQRVDVPSNPEQLADWLNDRCCPVDEGSAPFEPMALGKAAPLAPPPGRPDEPIQQSAEAIADWLLDHATQAEVEQVFSAIGCRWGEARKH